MSKTTATATGVPVAAASAAEVLRGAWRAEKSRLIRFLESLPDGHENIDPVTLKRLPVPY